MKHKLTRISFGLFFVMVLFLFLNQPFVLADKASVPIQESIIVDDEEVLVGRTTDTIVVTNGGKLTVLGLVTKDIIIEPGGMVYIYGVVMQNIINQGGDLEVYGIVAGYVYSSPEGDTYIDPDALVVATPPSSTPTPQPTSTPLSITPTPITVMPTPTLTPVPTATPVVTSTVHMIDLSISLYKSVPANTDRQPYEEIIEHFADGIYEMTNGAHKIRAVTIYENGANADTADVLWTAEQWPCANVTGVVKAGLHVYMGDIFPFYARGYDALSPANRRCSGYVLAHEWGHYYYGLYDEYVGSEVSYDNGSPQPDDIPVENSVMNDSWMACKADDFNWLNFSIAKNQTRRNAQYRVYGATAWETLIRPSSEDPRDGSRRARVPRSYYPDLVAFAPEGNDNASLELPSPNAITESRSDLDIIWAGETTDVIKSINGVAAPASATVSYRGFVNVVNGNTVQYPQPVLLVAQVIKEVPIANAVVHAGVRYPDGIIHTLELKDDGIAPDVTAADGLYSGFMLYEQEGDYIVFVDFDNRLGTAEFTETSLEHVPGPDGENDYPEAQPVGESFYVVANTSVTVSDIRSDDHGNTIDAATILLTANTDTTGRIDYVTDIDVFEVTPLVNHKLVLRLSGFAFDMQPSVYILDSDGKTRDTFQFIPEKNQYFFTSLRGKANQTFYIAVQHLDPNATGGIYDISIGSALPNPIESPPLSLFVILLLSVIGGLLLLGAFFWLRPQSVTKRVASPHKRNSVVEIHPRITHKKKPSGGSIYKEVREDSVEEEDDSKEDK